MRSDADESANIEGVPTHKLLQGSVCNTLPKGKDPEP
jgi:hypothetical protein